MDHLEEQIRQELVNAGMREHISILESKEYYQFILDQEKSKVIMQFVPKIMLGEDVSGNPINDIQLKRILMIGERKTVDTIQAHKEEFYINIESFTSTFEIYKYTSSSLDTVLDNTLRMFRKESVPERKLQEIRKTIEVFKEYLMIQDKIVAKLISAARISSVDYAMREKIRNNITKQVIKTPDEYIEYEMGLRKACTDFINAYRIAVISGSQTLNECMAQKNLNFSRISITPEEEEICEKQIWIKARKIYKKMR